MDQQEEICPGRSRAFGAHRRGDPHPARHRHLPCRTCGADMGCRLCSGPENELLCLNCKDWAHDLGLLQHGHVLRGAEREEGMKLLRSVVASIR